MPTEKTEGRQFLRVLWRLARQAALPLLAAVAYSAWDRYTATPQPSWSETVGKFSAAFFFVMWLVGQVLRVDRQMKVEDSLDDIKNAVDGLRYSLASAEQATAHAEKDTGVGSETRPLPEQALLSEADAAIDVGADRAALMVASAALEDALRRLLTTRGLQGAQHRSIGEILGRSGGPLDEATKNRLLKLWHTRNKVVHGGEWVTANPQSAKELVGEFREAVDLLSRHARPAREGSGIPCPRCKQLTMGAGQAENECTSCGFVSDED